MVLAPLACTPDHHGLLQVKVQLQYSHTLTKPHGPFQGNVACKSALPCISQSGHLCTIH